MRIPSTAKHTTNPAECSGLSHQHGYKQAVLTILTGKTPTSYIDRYQFCASDVQCNTNAFAISAAEVLWQMGRAFLNRETTVPHYYVVTHRAGAEPHLVSYQHNQPHKQNLLLKALREMLPADFALLLRCGSCCYGGGVAYYGAAAGQLPTSYTCVLRNSTLPSISTSWGPPAIAAWPPAVSMTASGAAS